MPHFFIDPGKIAAARFTIDGPEARHIITVMRCQAGSEIMLFDGKGHSYRGRITAIDRQSLSGVILGELSAPAARMRIRLFSSVPQGGRFDWLIEKAVELGVSAVIPLLTERCRDHCPSEAKILRWRRIALAAVKQCGRADSMEIGAAVRLPDAIAARDRTIPGLMPWEGEACVSLVSQRDLLLRSGSADVFIGPEGGFTADEVSAARAAGLMLVTLGQRILRVETAALLAAALALSCAGEYESAPPCP